MSQSGVNIEDGEEKHVIEERSEEEKAESEKQEPVEPAGITAEADQEEEAEEIPEADE